mgnify:CR=1 FL=1|tara:strand:+ start:1018 stop:1278 length:261 start_codon:yes stop_codon:yes gene_type:complete
MENKMDTKIHALDILKMKNVCLSATDKRLLIGDLNLDEKRYYGNWLLAEESKIEADDVAELDVNKDVKFGNKTYEDGLEKFVNNKD